VLTWPKLRALGVGFWLTDPTALRCAAEALAKAQFAATKDAHEPALMYAALGKKTVLQGLFRSSGNKKVRSLLLLLLLVGTAVQVVSGACGVLVHAVVLLLVSLLV
jgi:hypothetical protein